MYEGISNINGTVRIKSFWAVIEVERVDGQLACTSGDRRKLTKSRSRLFSMQRSHKQERNSCLRGVTDYNKVFGKAWSKTN